MAAPATPTGLAITHTFSDQIVLTWNAVVDATYYRIYRSRDDITYTGVRRISEGTEICYDDDVLESTQYYYKISAVNLDGESALSTAVNTTTLAISFSQSYQGEYGSQPFDSNGAYLGTTISRQSAVQNTDIYAHAKLHDMDDAEDHNSPAITASNVVLADASGYPTADSGETGADLSDAIAKKHFRLHDMDDALDHNSPGGVSNNLVSFDASGYPVNDSGISTTNSVTASSPMTDNTLIKGDGGGRGIQDTGISIDDSDNVSGVGTFGAGGGNFNIEADGTPVLSGSGTVWNDLQFPISQGKVPASNNPSWASLTTNTGEWGFNTGEYIDLASNELIHSWKEGTAGNFHVHLSIPSANATRSSQYIKVTIYVAYVNASSIWTETSLTAEQEVPDGSSSLENFYLDLGDVAFTGLSIGTQVKCRIERIAATGGTEYPSDVFFHQVGCHLEEDTIGSRTEASK